MNENHMIIKTYGEKADYLLENVFSQPMQIVSHYFKDIFVYCFSNSIKIPEKYYETATEMYLLV
jgi:hypothetical protein